jgi:hypothetical protein
MFRNLAVWPLAACLMMLSACSTASRDYSAYRAHMPDSILVLPPLNDTVEVNAPYTYLSTITMPLTEAGYYVYPVAVIDQMLKDNGLPSPGEMHTISLAKIDEIIGADSVLYVHITEWGQKYQVLASVTRVRANVRLVDVKTGTELYAGEVYANDSSGGSGDLLADLIIALAEQIIDSKVDQTYELSRRASTSLVSDPNNGLLPGPRSPKHTTDIRGR